MFKHTLTAAALAAVMATPAFAQSQTPTAKSPMNQTQMNKKPSPNLAPATDARNSEHSMPASKSSTALEHKNRAGFIQTQTAMEWRASKLIGASVYGPDDKAIGDVNDVVLTSDGSVEAAVVGVGGFLGVGEKNVAIPFDALNVKRKADSSSIEKITVSFSKEELKNAPKFAYYDAFKPETTGAGTGMKPLNAGPMTDHTKSKK
jgi:sporulation protein YlmC with PRC-barrel domain